MRSSPHTADRPSAKVDAASYRFVEARDIRFDAEARRGFWILTGAAVALRTAAVMIVSQPREGRREAAPVVA